MNPQVRTVVHPSEAEWPANLLRFHVEFQSLEATAVPQARVNLFDEQGRDVSGALADLHDGLWSPDGKWLTVLFHPGRIKSGLRAREQFGPALQEGKTYQLIVQRLDVASDCSVTFTAGDVEQRPLAPLEWTWQRQRRDRSLEFVLNLDRPVDALSAWTHLRLVGADGKPVAPPWAVHTRTVHFPFHPEAAGLRVASAFEDPCGNRVGRSFEVTSDKDNWPAKAIEIPIPRWLRIGARDCR